MSVWANFSAAFAGSGAAYQEDVTPEPPAGPTAGKKAPVPLAKDHASNAGERGLVAAASDGTCFAVLQAPLPSASAATATTTMSRERMGGTAPYLKR